MPYAPLLASVWLCAVAGSDARALGPSGGGYEVSSSVMASGGALKSGGAYAAKGAAGQRLSPAGPGLSAAAGYVNRIGFYNPPHFTFQKGLVSAVSFPGGRASLTLPPNAVAKEAFDITLNDDPVSVNPAVISAANSKMEANEGAWGRLFPGNITEMVLFDEESVWDRAFESSGLLALKYRDDNGDGVIDGSNPPVRVDTMKTWILDPGLEMWTKLPAALIDHDARTITVPFMAPGVYSLLGMIDDSVSNTYAFPVPFRPNGPNPGTGAGQTGTESSGITFTNVPQAGEIEIYTLDGRLVRKLPIPAGLTIPKITWDVRTAGGNKAASGVYIWRVESGANSKSGKLMVIW